MASNLGDVGATLDRKKSLSLAMLGFVIALVSIVVTIALGLPPLLG